MTEIIFLLYKKKNMAVQRSWRPSVWT